jgi:hypothetical protein
MAQTGLTANNNSACFPFPCPSPERIARLSAQAAISLFYLRLPWRKPQAGNHALETGLVQRLCTLRRLPGDRQAIAATHGLPHFAFLMTCASAAPQAENGFGGLAQRRGIKDTGAAFGWAIDDPQDMQNLNPALKLIREYRTAELVRTTKQVAFSRMSTAMRALVRGMDVFPSLRRMNRILQYQF